MGAGPLGCFLSFRQSGFLFFSLFFFCIPASRMAKYIFPAAAMQAVFPFPYPAFQPLAQIVFSLLLPPPVMDIAAFGFCAARSHRDCSSPLPPTEIRAAPRLVRFPATPSALLFFFQAAQEAESNPTPFPRYQTKHEPIARSSSPIVLRELASPFSEGSPATIDFLSDAIMTTSLIGQIMLSFRRRLPDYSPRLVILSPSPPFFLFSLPLSRS